MYKHFFKRLFDLTAALAGLILVSPLFVMVMIALALSNGGSPFFVQPRPGRHARVFKLLKFKTMTDRKDANGKLLPDRDRLTRTGSFIRSTSLDELPQLINVIKGDMSLVGPRPLLVKYLPLYNERQARRHEVTPGITGWTQVNGRNSIGWAQKFELDVWYVDHQGFLLDMKILWMTLVKVIRRSDINSAGAATMEAFTGNNQQLTTNN